MTPRVARQIRWTIEDLEGFPDNGNRYEIIDGELFVTRSPHLKHQDVAGLMYAALPSWSLQSKLGKPFIAPGVIFTEADAVIPDVIWISRDRLNQLLDEAGHLTGAPELVVEILSESAADKKRDRETKLKQYSVQSELNIPISEVNMTTVLNKPSSLIHEICLEKVGNWNLFKFSESLQSRMEKLLEKKKADLLTPEELGELDVIGELDRIFTHINAMIAAQNGN
jgi:hypothetical protein